MNFHFSISDDTLESFETSILHGKYHFKDKNLLRRALRGFIFIDTQDEARKVLAMSGNTTVRQILVNQGQERNISVGNIQDVITHVASNSHLHERGIAIGLDPFILKFPGQLGQPAGRVVMATTIEAIIGAVYIDSQKNANDCEAVMAALGLAWPE
ncbi:hypothetical protein N7541_000702 [Penicillium brevicompactum]|uniref:RNase III domain-containing protein n=1 Tax=Penicillium brevicompactum TaxID=5074 RepID=A0A9W9V5A1_PENBR|nr:hypothetical protein N7541_000702 [Penicillium brevicompactum]